MTKRNITKRRRRKRKLKYKLKGGADAAGAADPGAAGKSGPPTNPPRVGAPTFVTVEAMETALASLREEVFAGASTAVRRGGTCRSSRLAAEERAAAGLRLVAIEHFVQRIREVIGTGSGLPSPEPAPAPHVLGAVVVPDTSISGKGPPPGDGGEVHLDDPRENLNNKIDLLAKIILMDVSQAMHRDIPRFYGPNIINHFPEKWIQFYGAHIKDKRLTDRESIQRWTDAQIRLPLPETSRVIDIDDELRRVKFQKYDVTMTAARQQLRPLPQNEPIPF